MVIAASPVLPLRWRPSGAAHAAGPDMLVGCTWLITFQLAGEVTVRLFALPLPGPVVGLVFLYAVLVGRGGVPDDLRATSNTVLQHLMLLLVPATTGLMSQFERFHRDWLPIILAGVGGTALTMAATAVSLHLLVRKAPARRDV